MLAGVAIVAFLVALAAHGTKAGLRLAINTTGSNGRAWVSTGEDLLALCFATLAFLDPRTAVIGTLAVLLFIIFVAPTYWRAGALGTRSLRGWLSSLFAPGSWREGDQTPRRVRQMIGPRPIGAAPIRAARAALDAPVTGAFRNGWLLIGPTGPTFVYRTLRGRRLIPLPPPRNLEAESGPWSDMVHFEDEQGTRYTLYLLKDGPSTDAVMADLRSS
jgi:hypothetical protein